MDGWVGNVSVRIADRNSWGNVGFVVMSKLIIFMVVHADVDDMAGQWLPWLDI